MFEEIRTGGKYFGAAAADRGRGCAIKNFVFNANIAVVEFFVRKWLVRPGMTSSLVSLFLWSPYVIGQTIIFCPVISIFLPSFFFLA